MEIIVEYYEKVGFKAWLKTVPHVQGRGRSKKEAIGDMFVKWPKYFYIEKYYDWCGHNDLSYANSVPLY